MNMKLFIAAKAFIVDNNEVLIIKESESYKTGVHIGKFDLPGGKIKWEENILDGLRREVKEETSLRIEIGDAFFTNESSPEFKDEKWHIIRIFFRCKLMGKRSDVRLSNDHNELRWIKAIEYKKYNIIDNLHPCFEEIISSRK